ncbi:MAG: hypothetical protein HQL05_15635 [Nitrospirae bacterium]|nr:hypothetical protein [Nitrospirota bacterium]
MKKMIVFIYMVALSLSFISTSQALELEEKQMAINKDNVLLLLIDLAGQSYRCDSLLAHNRQALQEILSPESLSKANIANVYIGFFSENLELKYKIPIGRETDSVRFKKYSRKIFETINATEKSLGLSMNTSSERKYGRDAAGALGYVNRFIEEQHLNTKYTKVYIVFVSPLIQTISPKQTHMYLSKNKLHFPDNASLVVLAQAFNCQNVSQIEKNVAFPAIMAYWTSVLNIKEFKFLTAY